MPLNINTLQLDSGAYHDGVQVTTRNSVCRLCGEIPKGTHQLKIYGYRSMASLCRSCVEKAMVAFQELDRLIAAGLPTS